MNQQLNSDPRARQLLSEGMRAWRLLRDPRTPGAFKLIPVLGLLYVIFPIDLVPDLIPGAGQLDDLAVILVALRVFLQLAGQNEERTGTGSAPDAAVRNAPDPGRVVSANYRVQDD